MRRAIALLLFTASLFAQTTPPPPSAPREAKLPQAVERTLDNGLRVIVVPKPGLPLVAARLMIKAGAAADPKGRDGLAQLTASVVTKGTKTRTAEEIARGVEALGATLSAQAGWDSTSIDVSVMSPNLAKTMEYVADVARNATFAKDEVERERARAIDSLQVTLQQPDALASIAAARLIFGDAPYGHHREGLPSTLEKIARDDLVKFHRAHYAPNNAVLVFAGDVKPENAFALAKTQFGSWKRGAAGSQPARRTESAPLHSRAVIIDFPESGQSSVLVARRGIRRSDPDYMRAMVANAVLGGGYSSRLNQKIRIERGLSYGAQSWFEPRVDAGPFFATTDTKHESAAEVAGILASEMTRLSTADIPETELTPRKAALIGDFAFSLETTSGIVQRVSTLALYGMPLSEIDQYVRNVQAVKAEEVRTFAASHMKGDEVSIVVVGDAKQFEPALRKQFEDVEVIGMNELDLGSPVLRVRKKKE